MLLEKCRQAGLDQKLTSRSPFRPVSRRAPDSALGLLASHGRLTSSHQLNRSTLLTTHQASSQRKGLLNRAAARKQNVPSLTAVYSFGWRWARRLSLFQLRTRTPQPLVLLFYLVFGFHGATMQDFPFIASPLSVAGFHVITGPHLKCHCHR